MNWKNNFNNFLLGIKNAKITQSGDRLISKNCLHEIMRFVILTMLRNPKTDPFKAYEVAGKLYGLLPFDEKSKNQHNKGYFLKQVYSILYNVDNNAFELRGITFVQVENEWKRNILLNKFFNIGQCSQDDLYEFVIDNEIVKVYETHVFTLENGKTKLAKELTEKDNIKSW